MNKNLKRAVTGLCMALCLFSLSTTSKAETRSAGEGAVIAVDAQIQSEMEQLPAYFLSFYFSIPENQITSAKEQMKAEEALAGLAVGIDSWMEVRGELGAFVSVKDGVTVEAVDGGYTAAIDVEFEKRPVKFIITMDPEITKVTSVSFVPEYTTGERMGKMAVNVLIVLNIIMIVVSLYTLNKYKSVKESGREAEGVQGYVPQAAAPVAVQPVTQSVPVENLTNDLELVAVITAAIAASTGGSPEGLVVRSIKRAPGNNWKKAN